MNEDFEKKRKRKKLRNKIIIYIAGILVFVYVFITVYQLIRQPVDTFTVEEGTLHQEETDVGYVIRDETVVQGENYKNGMEKIVSEGSKVAVGESIFRYYTENEEELKEKISELDTKIQEAMESETTTLSSSDTTTLETNIQNLLKKISGVTDTTELEEYKKEIDELITKKANIAGELSPQGSYLKELISERQSYETQLNSGAEYVKSTISGVVSYKVDGYEDVLKPTQECFESLSEEYLENLDLKTGKVVSSSDELGKIIDNTYCYIATISSSDEAKNAELEDDVTLRLPTGTEVSAEITYIKEEENGKRLIIFKIEKGVEELIDYRKISFDIIWWSSTGYKIPNEAIVEENDLSYVVRTRAGYLSKLLVKVKKIGEEYSIVTSYDTSELIELGFTTSEISSMRSISQYDEILINPDLSEVDN